MSQLDNLIHPEINNFTQSYYAIQEYIKKVPLKNILEIGGGGGGSTEAVINSVNNLTNKDIKFISIELSKTRYNYLKNKFKYFPFYIPYNTSSVTIDKLPSEKEVEEFIKNTGIHGGDVNTVLSWLRTDIEYTKNNGLNENGIQIIKKDLNIDTFCFVILDSGEFCSNAEFNELPNCDAYFLDDINAYKNWYVHRTLENNNRYIKIFQENIRGGSSLFCKKEIAEKYFPNGILF
jgi:hypothetical protein